MGQYRPGVNIPMVRSANMSSMTSPHPQSIVRDETGEYEDVQRDLRQSYTPEYRTMYPQSASTPSTVRSVARDQMDRDSASANVAMKPSDMGRLTEEQKQARDKHIESMHRALFSNYLIDEQQQEMNTIARSARTAYKEPKFESHQAMPAITVRDSAIYNRQATLLAQQWGRDKVSASTQTEQIKMVEMSTQTVVEMSTQTEPENQLVSFAENVSPGNVVQGKQQEMQLMTTGVSTVDNGEIDYEEMPDLVYDTSEETLESEWFKLQFLSRNDYSCAPSGPFKEEPIGDRSETIFTLQMLAGQDGLEESCVTHWQEHTKHAEFKAGTQTGETDGSQQGQEQENQDHNLWRQTKSIEAKNHSYRHGSERTSSTSQQSSSVSRLAGV